MAHGHSRNYTTLTDATPATSVSELPTVGTYFERVGAEIRTPFRAAVMGEVDGYPKPTGWINFDPKDGSVKVTGSAEAPTPDEQEAIANEFKRAEFPKQLALLALADTPPGVNMADPNVFTCHNLRGEITMIHQRYETKSGGKGFLPWTRWSDGEWRKVEPEVMPFFGIPGYQNKTTLFIHEGAKAAKRNLDMGHANLEKERLIIDELEAVAGLTVWKGDARPKIGGSRGEKSTVAFNFDIEPGTTWGQVEDRLTTLEKLGFCAPM